MTQNRSVGNRTSMAPWLAVVLLLPLLLMVAPASAQEPLRGNPGAGLGIFRGYCRACHGDDLRGTGPVGVYLEIKPADLTGITKRNGGTFPEEKVAQAIRSGQGIKGHGNSEMPIWGEAFKIVEGGQTQHQVDQRVADLVALLKSIQVR